MAKRLVVLLVLSASVLACRGSAFIQSLGSIPQPVDFGRIAFRNGRMEIFPLSFIYAVVRHRVLGVSLAIRRGLQYALMSRGVLVAEGIAVFIALYLVVAPFPRRARGASPPRMPWQPPAPSGTRPGESPSQGRTRPEVLQGAVQRPARAVE